MKKRNGAGICEECKSRPRTITGKHPDDKPRYSKLCTVCRKSKYEDIGKRRRWKGNVCEQCGFVPENLCQLDIDHIIPISEGGDDIKQNTQTLCSNCHRLKSNKERIERANNKLLERAVLCSET